MKSIVGMLFLVLSQQAFSLPVDYSSSSIESRLSSLNKDTSCAPGSKGCDLAIFTLEKVAFKSDAVGGIDLEPFKVSVKHYDFQSSDTPEVKVEIGVKNARGGFVRVADFDPRGWNNPDHVRGGGFPLSYQSGRFVSNLYEENYESTNDTGSDTDDILKNCTHCVLRLHMRNRGKTYHSLPFPMKYFEGTDISAAQGKFFSCGIKSNDRCPDINEISQFGKSSL